MVLGLPGDPFAVYTNTERGGVSAGDIAYDPIRRAKFIFLMNNAATSINPKLACVALGTNKSSYFCALAAATKAVAGFAGVRLPLADAVPQNSFGWFQCGGKATFTAGVTTTTADARVVTSDAAAGNVEAVAATVASLGNSFGEAVTTTASGDVVVMIDRNVWGV